MQKLQKSERKRTHTSQMTASDAQVESWRQGAQIAKKRAEQRALLAQPRPRRLRSSTTRQKTSEKEALPAQRTTTCTVRANSSNHITVRMHSKQMIKQGLAQCITMRNIRALKPSRMHSMSVCKSQQQEQRQQQQRGVRTTRFHDRTTPSVCCVPSGQRLLYR